MDDIKLKVEYISIDDLKPYERNAKLHPVEQIEQIARSIKDYGMNDPIGVWKDNVIIEGHGRLEACKRLGIDTVPIVRLDHLTEEQRREYALVHNQTTMNSDFDADVLDFELKDLAEFDAGFYDFSEHQETESLNSIVEDEVPEKVETRCKLGNLWQLGDHRLICGDSTDPEVIENLTGGCKDIDLYITDPPYNVDYEGGTKDALKIMNDSMEDSAFRAFLTDAFKSADSFMRPGAAFYIWHADSEGYNFRAAVRSAGWTLRQNLIWVKNSIVLGRQDYQWKHEPCLYGWKSGTHYFFDDRTEATVIDDKLDIRKLKKDQMIDLLEKIFSDKNPTTVLYEDKPQRNDVHPTMKPVRLIARLIRNSSKRSCNILDSFGGSGTTLIACEQLGRKAFLCELDPHYCDVIIQRWENLTGKQAILMTEGSNETGS